MRELMLDDLADANDDYAASYARFLLGAQATPQQLGFVDCAHCDHPAISWLRSGLQDLTGFADSPGWLLPAPVSAGADGALLAFQALLNSDGRSDNKLSGLRGAQLLGERARLMRLSRRGARSPGGSCHLIACSDGVLAVNLARDEDRLAMPAWAQAEVKDIAELSRALAPQSARVLMARAREMGLPIAKADDLLALNLQNASGKSGNLLNKLQNFLVVDLSSLWAGPLAGNLLQLSGARVIKVESEQRPDGARRGDAKFFDLLNAGKQSVMLDFKSNQGIRQLKRLLLQADIVIESSRPRALRQFGVDADEVLRQKPELVWLSITAYGRKQPQGNWVGFGDDVAAAAGLSAMLRTVTGHWVFAGDALADPLTGIHGALLAYQAWRLGRGGLIDLSMHAVVSQCAQWRSVSDVAGRMTRWRQIQQSVPQDTRYPMRVVAESAAVCGVDNERVFQVA